MGSGEEREKEKMQALNKCREGREWGGERRKKEKGRGEK